MTVIKNTLPMMEFDFCGQAQNSFPLFWLRPCGDIECCVGMSYSNSEIESCCNELYVGKWKVRSGIGMYEGCLHTFGGRHHVILDDVSNAEYQKLNPQNRWMWGDKSPQ